MKRMEFNKQGIKEVFVCEFLDNRIIGKEFLVTHHGYENSFDKLVRCGELAFVLSSYDEK